MSPKVHFKKYQQIISLLLIICFVTIPLTFLTLPKKAEAVCTPFTFPAIPDPFSVPTHKSETSATEQADQTQKSMTWFKTCILDGLATMIAKTIIKQLTSSIVKWINSGFKGNPSFVQNPGKFFAGVGDKVAGNIIENIAPFLCSPFRLNIQLALSLSMTAPAEDELGCTLTDVENNFGNFVNGTNSNWDNWFQITQNPQNNPYGALGIAQGQVGIGIETAQGKYQQQLDWGKGFLSFESCPSTQSDNTISGTAGEVSAPTEVTTVAMSNKDSIKNMGSFSFINGLYNYNFKNDQNNNGTVIAEAATAGTAFVGSNTGLSGDTQTTFSPTTPQTPQNTPTVGNKAPTTEPNWSLTSGMSLGSSNVNNVHTNADNPNDKNVYDANNQPVYGVQAGNNGCVTETPGAVIENQLENSLGSDLRGLEIAQSIDQIVAALVGQLVSQVMGGIGGLAKAGRSSSSGGVNNSFNYQNSIGVLGSSTQAIPDLPITGACSPNVQNANIGDPVTWSVYIPDINGPVTYTWYGENLGGNAASASTFYTTNGKKTASVIITPRDTTKPGVLMDCYPDVIIGETASIETAPTISCAPSFNSAFVGTPITWQAIAIGGVPPFVYSWQGDEGLSGTGQSVVKSYSTVGTKTATASVTSADGNTYVQACKPPVTVTQSQ